MPGEEDLIGAGIHICATCDGPFYKYREVVVVGGGNSGVEEGLFLTKFASKVTVLEFQDQLDTRQILREKAERHPNMVDMTCLLSFSSWTRLRPSSSSSMSTQL